MKQCCAYKGCEFLFKLCSKWEVDLQILQVRQGTFWSKPQQGTFQQLYLDFCLKICCQPVSRVLFRLISSAYPTATTFLKILSASFSPVFLVCVDGCCKIFNFFVLYTLIYKQLAHIVSRNQVLRTTNYQQCVPTVSWLTEK